MKSLLNAALITTFATFSYSAKAVIITFGGVNPGDGSFLTSSFTPENQINPALGIFNETFDDGQGGCAVNSAAQGIAVSGNYWLTKGLSAGLAAPPANDTTCYAAGPASLSSVASENSVTIDWSNFLATNLPGRKINYLGLYWGSIDGYNDITFYSKGAAINIASINGAALNKTKLNGSDILQFGGNSGDQANPNTNRYVNLFFGEDEQFDKLVFTSSSYAFEIDNLVIKVADVDKQVSAPGTFALFGFVIAALGWSRRRF
jgi:hypothetical protein